MAVKAIVYLTAVVVIAKLLLWMAALLPQPAYEWLPIKPEEDNSTPAGIPFVRIPRLRA